MEKKIKSLLKKLKLNEQTLSTLLGAFVILIVGVLIFNYFKSSESSDLVLDDNQEETFNSEEQAGTVSNSDTYVVEANDSLWKISEKIYNDGYKWIEIAQANSLINPNHLEAGQELKLPEVSSQEENAQVVLGENSITADNYTVQEGDSLWKIAVRAYGDGYKWTDIANANNLYNPNHIEKDQTLTLPR